VVHTTLYLISLRSGAVLKQPVYLWQCGEKGQGRLHRTTDEIETAVERCVSTTCASKACPIVPIRPQPGCTRFYNNVKISCCCMVQHTRITTIFLPVLL